MGQNIERLGIKVLYVEDEDVVRNIINEMLRRRIETVLLAGDGLEGLELFIREKPSLVVTDIKMPRMDGLEMIAKIKEIDAEVPIIITSAHSDSNYFIRAIDLGVDKFVLKPIDNRELFKQIKRIADIQLYQQEVAREQSRRKIAERNLREMQEQARAIYENALVGMCIVDVDFQLLFSNQALGRMLFRQENELLSDKLTSFLAPESITLVRMQSVAGKEATGRLTRFQSEERLILPDGELLWVEISVSAILTADNIIGKFILVINDINERKATQAERDELYSSLLSELETAAMVQSFFLPDWICLENILLFTNNYTPSTNVGGDLFDIINLGSEHYLVYMGDISGHGVQGALIMTAVKATLKMLVEKLDSFDHPSQIINQLNRLLAKDLFQNNYLTLVLGIIDMSARKMVLYNAGHPPVIRYCQETNEAEVIKTSGAIPIGWMPEYQYTPQEELLLEIDECSTYLFYTDGIFECSNGENEELGITGVLEILQRCGKSGSKVMLPYIMKQQITSEGYDISKDDFTILSMNFNRDINNQIRYYSVNPLREKITEAGKRCQEFLQAAGREANAFSVELLVNEFLNLTIEKNIEEPRQEAIIFRLTTGSKFLELTFWDRGINWQIPVKETSDAEPFARINIIKKLTDKYEQVRLPGVNQTTFWLEVK